MFSKDQLNEILNTVKKLVVPYLELNPDVDEGLANRFKFTNDRHGVEASTIKVLDNLAETILENPKIAQLMALDDLIYLLDALVLFSNHLDQAPLDKSDSAQERQRRILHWLDAAKSIVDQQGSIEFLLSENKIRYLSSVAQFDHYYGKALRYREGVAIETRLGYLNEAIEIAQILQQINNPKDNRFIKSANDPHGYEDRIATFKWPIIYTYINEKNYDLAITEIEDLMNSGITPFHQLQAENQYANVYILQGKLDDAESHVLKAITIYNNNQDNITKALWLNSQVILMNIYFEKSQIDTFSMRKNFSEKALQTAEMILKDPLARDTQTKPAQKVIELLPKNKHSETNNHKTTSTPGTFFSPIRQQHANDDSDKSQRHTLTKP